MVVLDKDSSTTKQQKYVLINASKMLYRYFIYFMYSFQALINFGCAHHKNTKNRLAIHTTYTHRMYWYLVLLPGTVQHEQEDARLPAHNISLYIYVCNIISVIVLSFVQKIIAEFTYRVYHRNYSRSHKQYMMHVRTRIHSGAGTLLPVLNRYLVPVLCSYFMNW